MSISLMACQAHCLFWWLRHWFPYSQSTCTCLVLLYTSKFQCKETYGDWIVTFSTTPSKHTNRCIFCCVVKFYCFFNAQRLLINPAWWWCIVWATCFSWLYLKNVLIVYTYFFFVGEQCKLVKFQKSSLTSNWTYTIL